MRERLHFLLLNIGHFLDHLFTLIFATVAALALHREWGLGYADLLKFATPGFFAFGVFALPAGWLADKWSREGMMSVFFVGIGLASIATAFARTPLEIGIGLFVVGVFAAIYHPVGLAIVVEKWKNTGMRIAVNGVWGNLGVASAALITGYFIDHGGWRTAFVVPGVVSILIGIAYTVLMWPRDHPRRTARARDKAAAKVLPADLKALLLRVSMIVFLTTAVSSVVFQSTTFALPKVFDERLGGIAMSATALGQLAFMVFALASIGQLIVGHLLDRLGPRTVFVGAAAIQVVFFAIMPGLFDWAALAVRHGLHAGSVRANPHQRLYDRAPGRGRMARAHLRRALRGELHRAGGDLASDRLRLRELGLRRALPRAGGLGRDHPGCRAAAAAAAADAAGSRGAGVELSGSSVRLTLN